MTQRFCFDPTKNLIVVDAEIWSADGKYCHIIPLALDTGASTTIIPWEVAEYLGYKPCTIAGSERRQIVTDSGVEFVPEIRVTAIQVLGKRLCSLPAYCHDLPQACFVSGLLGLNFFKKHILKIDLKKGYIHLE